MSIRCGACGRFIGHDEKFVTDYEPLSEFGPEVIDFAHVRCAQGMARDSAETEGLRPLRAAKPGPKDAP